MKVSDEVLLPTVPADANVRETAKTMQKTNSGAVLLREKNSVVGIVTDRDLVIRVLADDKAPLNAPIRDFCTQEMFTCTSTDSLETAAHLMESHHVRYLLVLNPEGEAVGLISFDVIAAKSGDAEFVGDVAASGHRRNAQAGPHHGEMAPIAK